MQPKVNPNIAGLTPYKPGKPVDELTRELGITDAIKLASNENPNGPGAGVRQAIADAARELSRYPDGGGFHLKEALAGLYRVGAEQLTLGNGSNDVLELAAKMALEPGAEAIVSEHAFVVYRLAVAACGANLVEVPARDFGIDLGGMLAAVTGQTRIVFIANPNNPTGTWVREKALVDFLEQLPTSVWVVLDEAYFEYVDEADYPDGVALTKRFANLIVARTFSKIYALASLRLGYGISSPLAADLMNRARQPFNVNSVALVAGIAALRDTEFVSRSRTQNLAGMRQLVAGLQALGRDFIPSVGNFVTFDAGPKSAAVNQALLTRGVIVRPVAEYGLPQHLRVTVGLPKEIDRFLSAMGELSELFA